MLKCIRLEITKLIVIILDNHMEIVIMQNKLVDIETIITNLHGLGICLKIAASKLPDSTIKQYLLLEISKPIEIKSVAGFCLLQTKISNIIDIAVQEKLSDSAEVMRLLEDIIKDLNKDIKYVKENGVF